MALTRLLERLRTITHLRCLRPGWGALLQDCTGTRVGSSVSTVVNLALERPTPAGAAEVLANLLSTTHVLVRLFSKLSPDRLANPSAWVYY